MTEPFETVTFTQSDEVQNQLLMKELRDAVSRNEIRIVDIKRYQNHLIVTFRRVSNTLPY
jgi:hypothetical protein